MTCGRPLVGFTQADPGEPSAAGGGGHGHAGCVREAPWERSGDGAGPWPGGVLDAVFPCLDRLQTLICFLNLGGTPQCEARLGWMSSLGQRTERQTGLATNACPVGLDLASGQISEVTDSQTQKGWDGAREGEVSASPVGDGS